MIKSDKPYIKSVDAIRVISILGVLLIHTTTKILEFTRYDLTTYASTLFTNQFARFAVPLFFLISGFVLELNYDYHASYISYLKKRVSRIVIPYLFWSLIYYFFIFTTNRDNFINVILTGDASYQLYFIPTLCIFYAAFPLLHKFYKLISNPITLAFLGIAQYYFLYQDYFIKHGGEDFPTRIITLSFFVFLLGIIAARNKERVLFLVEKLKYFLILAAGYFAYYIFSEGKNMYYRTFNIGAFYSQWRPSVLIYTIIAGLLLFYLFEKSDLKSLSKLSYLVFFIHVIVLEETWKIFSRLVNPNPLFSIGFFVTVSAFSFLIAFIVHKIPHLSKVTG